MEQLEQRLGYLEQSIDELNMQNRVLAAAFKGLIQAAFEDEVAELSYGNSLHAELFQDAAYAFFREKG